MAGERAGNLGALVRRWRTQRGLRLEDLAKRAGYTKGFLSKIETGRSSPPIATLMRVAQALAVDPALFFQSSAREGAPGDPNASVHVRSAARAKVENAGAGPGYDYWSLAAPRLHKAMEPFLITVRPEEVFANKRFQHPGEEWIFVLEGRCEYHVGREVFALARGDSLYFDAARPHAPVPKDGPVTFLAVFCAPPRRGRMAEAAGHAKRVRRGKSGTKARRGGGS